MAPEKGMAGRDFLERRSRSGLRSPFTAGVAPFGLSFGMQ